MSLWKQAILCLVLRRGGRRPAGTSTRIPRSVGLARESATGIRRAAADGRQGGGRQNRIPGLIGGGAVNVVTAPVETDKSGDTVMALGTAKAVRSVTLYPAGLRHGRRDRCSSPARRSRPARRSCMLDDEEEQVAVGPRAHRVRAGARRRSSGSQALAKSKTISSVALSDAEMAAQLAENRACGPRRSLLRPAQRHGALRRHRRPDRHLDRRPRHQHHARSPRSTISRRCASTSRCRSAGRDGSSRASRSPPRAQALPGLEVRRQDHRHRQPRRRDDAHAAPAGRPRQLRPGC